MNGLVLGLLSFSLVFLPLPGPQQRVQKKPVNQKVTEQIMAGDVMKVDLTGKNFPPNWRPSSKSWKVEEGEIRGMGGGYVEYSLPIDGDFGLYFEGWTEEKGNIEVKLIDPATKKECFTFAFLGQYHPTLDGVKFAMLKGDRFVHANPRMWIFPGRFFNFSVRMMNNQYRMFLNGEEGGLFLDDHPDMKDFLIRIMFSGEGSMDKVRIKDIMNIRPT